MERVYRRLPEQPFGALALSAGRGGDRPTRPAPASCRSALVRRWYGVLPECGAVIHTYVLRLRDAGDEGSSLAGEVEDVATGRVTRVIGGEHLLAVLSGRSGGDGTGDHPGEGHRPAAG